jgi:glycine/D-amino acid oxidase-like deaminating enzyme
MRVAVLGGGLQGCCIALALADRGVEVALFDRNHDLLSRTAVANEGKIHLGYMYANDPTYSTARMMMRGALAFAPFFERHLAVQKETMTVSRPAVYVVHRDSQRSPEEVLQYLSTAHAMIREASEGRAKDYFGRDLSSGLREWSTSDREEQFDPTTAIAAFDTPEVAIDPIPLAQAVRARIKADPRVEVRLRHHVQSVDDAHGLELVATGPDGGIRERYDHIVNALWEGRLLLNDGRGLRPGRPWLHRLKYGISLRLPKTESLPPSATFVSGPFGEVVSYSDGLTYLTWYPVCLRAISTDLAPPEWPTYPSGPLRSQILEGTLKVLSQLVLSLRSIEVSSMDDIVVKGGAIVAWGKTDIYDPQSELHRRFEIGVSTADRFHSVDPGKLTMAPYFAEVCADRILEGT